MKNFKNLLVSQLKLTRGERAGMLVLALLIVVLFYLNNTLSFSSEISALDVNSETILEKQRQLDSLRTAAMERRKPKVYPFNPNFMTDYKAYTLGISPKEFDRLKSYRGQDKWVNSVKDFQQVTMISDSLLQAIAPRFKFPKWVTTPKPKYSYQVKKEREKSFAEKIDLNSATSKQLQEVRGIGEVFGNRIVAYREKIDGFVDDIQLRQVWGLKPEVIDRILLRFTVKTPKPVVRVNVNTASASDLATIPGVSFDLAKKIWEFVRLREGVATVDEIAKIDEISAHKLQLIELYLFAE